MSGRDGLSANRIKVQSEARVTMPKSVAELRRILEAGAVPDDAKVLAEVVVGDQREPGYTTLVFQWVKEA